MTAARYRVLLTDRAWPDSSIEREILGVVGAELIEAPDTRESTLQALAREVDAIAANWAPVTESVIRQTTRCQIISRTGIGLDNIAVNVATQLEIPVTNVPDYCVGEVADHALALLLACARNITYFHARTKRGEYRLQNAPSMRRLAGQTLGLFGLGRIGQALAGMARGLGLVVIAHTASGNDHGVGCPMVTRDELLTRSDFISLHAPLTPDTRHVFGMAALEQMKNSAYLINTSRGGLIDHAALWHALQTNQIAGAALDVFEPEPPDLSHPLFQDERVIVTPHAAFVSIESLIELRTRVARQIADRLSGRRPENVVNPQVLG
ncbi:MAG: C-terminal binding protein [Planctomycetes bacterium]|nr:C-terminal binding protein [Planctomycetota bacterium]